MDSIVETCEIDGLTVNVRYDHTPTISPREYTESTFFGFHTRYKSPDAAPDPDAFQARRMMRNPELISIPVWLYDHSGTCYKASESNPFHCPWDSGLFGYIYISRADARDMMGVKRLNADTIQKVRDILTSEVDVYSQWANGQVYGYEVVDDDGEQIDSCWGYIADSESAMADGKQSARHAAACIQKDAWEAMARAALDGSSSDQSALAKMLFHDLPQWQKMIDYLESISIYLTRSPQ